MRLVFLLVCLPLSIFAFIQGGFWSGVGALVFTTFGSWVGEEAYRQYKISKAIESTARQMAEEYAVRLNLDRAVCHQVARELMSRVLRVWISGSAEQVLKDIVAAVLATERAQVSVERQRIVRGMACMYLKLDEADLRPSLN